ncbi:MAG: response regulator [Deltaproteobacteria bacterium]|nr:response regulator [Deltaproteobacteria bacterium]
MSENLSKSLEIFSNRPPQDDLTCFVGDSFFKALLKKLCKEHQVDFAFIGKTNFLDQTISTIAFLEKDEFLDCFSYQMSGTPCQNVSDKRLCIYPSNVQERFPDDTYLVEKQIHAYAGTPLFNTSGEVIGLLSVMNKKDLPNSDKIIESLQSLVPRVSAELEREIIISELAVSKTEIAEKEKQLRTLINAIPDFVCFKDSKGRWLEVNSFGQKIFGLNEAVFRGKTGKELAEISPQYQKIWENCKDSDEDAWQQTHFWRGEQVVKKDDGSQITVDVIKVPVFHSNGERKGLLVVGRDISEKKEAEKIQLELEKQLLQSQKMEAIGQLAGGVAHDFNNMLGVILGNAQLVIQQLSQDSNIRNNVQQIENASERAAALVNKLLTFGRKEIITPKVVNPNEIIEGTCSLLLQLLPKTITLKRNFLTKNTKVKLDPIHLEQILLNLTLNARDAVDSSGVIEIRTETVYIDQKYVLENAVQTTGLHFKLSVSDDGTGMSKETISRIFEPFYTTKGLEKGTGLGLSTVHGIVKNSNGHIAVQSELNKGTTFSIFFPAALEELEQRFSTLESAANRNRIKKILICEDEELVRDLIVQILEPHSFELVSVRNGTEALNTIERTKDFDLIISDVGLPDTSGEILAQKVRKLLPDIAILLISGHAPNQLSIDELPDKIVRFLSKPFTPSELLDEINILSARIEPGQFHASNA